MPLQNNNKKRNILKKKNSIEKKCKKETAFASHMVQSVILRFDLFFEVRELPPAQSHISIFFKWIPFHNKIKSIP